jgi:Domain of unknown function (DUF4279)
MVNKFSRYPKLHLSLRIQGNIKPMQVTELLEMNATDISEIGDLGAITQTAQRKGYWHFSTIEISRQNSLHLHCRYLASKFKDKIEKLQTLKDQGADIYIACYWADKKSSADFILTMPILDELAVFDSLNLRLWFDIYSLPDE